ncbi:ABC transporter ATP-binding protein [Risungbinella massiliensis]|uniref:ABC transporter ATP-binding protein n=1 Tax=Risungbinella massiliensis TaxID=1329796 RepID=UPI0005CC67A9|nr:ABC transporter ATP-binding protein [Risungbinella massiliensis]
MLRAKGLHKSYGQNESKQVVLPCLDLEVPKGEFLAIMGESGSGKTTLLHLLSLLDQPDQGELWLNGMEMQEKTEEERTLIRQRQIGFVFQFFHLIPMLTVLENVMLPVELQARVTRSTRREARELLELVGLSNHEGKYPAQLSGGQQQRVAIARSLLHCPQILMADEPTGSLDSLTSREMMRLFQTIHQRDNQTMVMVTHDPHVASYADRVLFLRDGKWTGEYHADQINSISDRTKEIRTLLEEGWS